MDRRKENSSFPFHNSLLRYANNNVYRLIVSRFRPNRPTDSVPFKIHDDAGVNAGKIVYGTPELINEFTKRLFPPRSSYAKRLLFTRAAINNAARSVRRLRAAANTFKRTRFAPRAFTRDGYAAIITRPFRAIRRR